MKWRLAGVGTALLLLAGAGVWLARSDWLRDKVLLEIVSEAERVTGGAVKLQAFRLEWRTLTAEVDHFEIRGTEPADQAALLTVDKIRVGLTIVSLWSRDIRVRFIEASHPRAHLMLLGNGKTNIPEPKIPASGKDAAQTLLDLRIGAFDVHNGEFLVAETVTPWEARGQQLQAHVAWDPRRLRYSAHLNVAALQVKPYTVEVAADAALEAGRLSIAEATLKTTGSELRLRNTMLHHFSDPVWTGQYEARLALREFVKRAQGTVTASGSGTFASLRDYRVSGRMQGSELSVASFRHIAAAGDFDATPARIAFSRATVRVLGGELSGSGELTGYQHFKASGHAQHFDLAQVIALRTPQKLPYDALLAGSFQVEGTLARQNADARLTVSPAKSGAPVRGEIDVHFDTALDRLELGHSWLDLPHSRVEVAGTLGDHLDVKAESADASELLPLLPLEVKPAISWGDLRFQGTVTGPLRHPLVAGFAAGKAVRYQAYTLDAIAGDFTLTENKLMVSRGEGTFQSFTASASGSLDLTGWQVLDRSPLVATVDWTDADISKLSSLPVTGFLSGHAQVSGTVAAPRANADVTLNNGLMYGQPYNSVSAKVQYLNRTSQSVTGILVSGPKRVNIGAQFDSPDLFRRGGTLTFNLTSNTMPLHEINLVREREPDILGFGKFHAEGTAALRRNARGEWEGDLTSLNADASANSVALGGRNFGDARLIATTKGSVLSANFDSNAASASIHGEGTLRLGGDYPVEGKVQFRNAGLNALAALALKSGDSSALSFEGNAEGEVDIAGPLKKPADITARLNIPRLEIHPLPGSDLAHSMPNFSLVNNGPVRATLSRSVLRIESARLKAPETDLTLGGSITLAEVEALNLRVQGTVNLALLRSASTDLTAGGSLSLDSTVRGTFATPDVSGRATVRDGDFHYAGFSNGLSIANGEFAFNGTRATIQSLSAESGGGKVDATGFAAYTGGQFSFRIETRARGIRVRYPEGVSSISDADLTLAGTTRRSTVSGSITVHRIAINPKSDAATILALSAQPLKTASAQNSLASNMNFDVQISTAPDVALQTSVTQSLQADASLRLRGTLTNPALLGRINVTQGEIVFFGNKYSINQGTVSFFNAAKIEPVLNLDLETKARGVDVILTVSGPIHGLNLSYRSDPPLQFSDIVALLATGRTPSDPTLAVRDTGQSQSFQQLGTDTLIGQAIANPVAGRLQRFFGVSRLKIDPQLTGITGSPQARLTIEQQVTPDILFTYITDVSSTSTQLIRVEWAVNRNWSAILIREENGYVGLDFAFKKGFK